MDAHAGGTLARAAGFIHKGLLTQILWIVGFASATALAARLEIPHQPVPYTLQTMVVILAGAFLGGRNGAISQILYLAAGFAGAPVFAGGAFGLAKLLGPTGGYLLAFPVAAACVGIVIQGRSSVWWQAASMATGLVVILTIGTIHLSAFTLHDSRTAFISGFLLFTWWDLLKLAAATMIYHEVAKRWPVIPGR